MLGKNYLFLFPSKTHKKFPSQEDKIGWFPSQLKSEQAPSRRTTIDPSVGGGGLNLVFLTKLCFQCYKTSSLLRRVLQQQKICSATSSKHLQLCQPARFLWGTDKVRNRFVECPCSFSHPKLCATKTMLDENV